MNIVFLGTPEIARVCLEEIVNSKHKVLAVITNPDRPAGRGKHLMPSPVKTFATERGIKVLQFENVSVQGAKALQALKPDVLVLVAFGQILSQEILDIALPINLHGSLLPALRGPSPIQSAIINGLTQTGVSVMKMEKTMDSGPVMLQSTTPILPTDTAETLFNKIATVGAKTLVQALDLIETGKAVWKQQNHKNATFCNMLTKENAKINFAQNAKQVVDFVRGYNPNPVAYFVLQNTKFKVFKAQSVNCDLPPRAKAGQVLVADAKKGLWIATCDGAVEILELQTANGKKMTAKQYLAGKKIQTGVLAQ